MVSFKIQQISTTSRMIAQNYTIFMQPFGETWESVDAITNPIYYIIGHPQSVNSNDIYDL